MSQNSIVAIRNHHDISQNSITEIRLRSLNHSGFYPSWSEESKTIDERHNHVYNSSNLHDSNQDLPQANTSNSFIPNPSRAALISTTKISEESLFEPKTEQVAAKPYSQGISPVKNKPSVIKIVVSREVSESEESDSETREKEDSDNLDQSFKEVLKLIEDFGSKKEKKFLEMSQKFDNFEKKMMKSYSTIDNLQREILVQQQNQIEQQNETSYS